VVRIVKRFALTAMAASLVIGLTSVRVQAAESHSQEVVRQGDNIFVSFKYRKGLDMHLEIGRCGINGLLNIKALWLLWNSLK